MKAKLLIPILAVSLFLIFSASFYASAQSVTIDITAGATYGGVVTVNGSVIPNPGSNQEVNIAVNNPVGVNVLNSVVSVNGANGAFTYSSPAGGSSAWINGTYTVAVTWGTLTSTYTNHTTFQYGATTTTTTTSSSSQATFTTTTTFTSTTTSVSTTTQSTTITTATTVTTQTTVTATTTTTKINAMWEYIGIAGIAAAVVLAGLTVFMMRRY